MAALRRLSGLFGVVNNYCSTSTASILNKNIQFPVYRCRQIEPFRELNTYLPWIPNKREKIEQVEVPEVSEHEEKLMNDIIKTINNQLDTNTESRLFAIVALCGKQYKVTENDLIIVQGYWPPTSGDTLKLEKVLLVGGKDFTLIGQPILNREIVSIDATVIDKTFSHTKIMFRMLKRKQYRRTRFMRTQHTMLRINSINVQAPIDVKKDVEGLDRIY